MPFRGDDGIYEEDFIEERRKGLEQFVNKYLQIYFNLSISPQYVQSFAYTSNSGPLSLSFVLRLLFMYKNFIYPGISMYYNFIELCSQIYMKCFKFVMINYNCYKYNEK
jgi:hypothetical protein